MSRGIKNRIRGRVNIARRRLDRSRRTRGGLAGKKRRVFHDIQLDGVLCRGDNIDPATAAMLREEKARVLSGINRFTTNERHRELLVRRLLCGEVIREVAEELGISSTAARSIILRARRFLQNHL